MRWDSQLTGLCNRASGDPGGDAEPNWGPSGPGLGVYRCEETGEKPERDQQHRHSVESRRAPRSILNREVKDGSRR